MKLKICRQISDIPAAQWNALIEHHNPFLRHEFLRALENHGCVSQRLGWQPCHIALFENDQLKAAMPLYEKYNSSGEFVFDHTWADAFHRNGIHYYPKLVCAVPHTPTLGQRLLCKTEHQQEMFPLLLQASLKLAQQIGASSVHCLFPTAPAQDFMRTAGLSIRHDCQFHWQNQRYQDFDHFLSKLTSKKRKNIRQERRKVAQAGITFRLLDGHTASPQDWVNFNGFYQRTFLEKRNTPKFNLEFFMEVAEQLPQQTFLVLADHGNQCVAGALMYRSDTHLYGRHWGASEHYSGLHFEACYYQGIDYCIRENLQWFEPGAQGEHKISRGFLPTRTVSAHWIAHSGFSGPIADFCAEEQIAVKDYMAMLEESNPYRKEAP